LLTLYIISSIVTLEQKEGVFMMIKSFNKNNLIIINNLCAAF